MKLQNIDYHGSIFLCSSILLQTLPGCVMVAQEILVLFVRVRILSGEIRKE